MIAKGGARLINQSAIKTLKNKLRNLKLGIAEKSIWGRKMKIRLTSADTGRKIDFNITFDLIKEKSEE